MSAEERILIEIAARVSDGTPVDWDREERNAEGGRLREQIRHLRLVSDVASVHRSLDLLALSTVSPCEMSTTVDCARLRPGSEGSSAEAQPRPSRPAGDQLERWGRLEIREKLGEGGFGEVYRAFDANLDREVALKLLKRGAGSSERVNAVLDEGRMLARVRHPNVITVHGAETHDGRVGLWMEFVRGNTLARLIREQGRFGAREATLIGIDLCRAMAAVHRAGLIHRDIKPENAMRDEDGRFVLMDFGAGQRLADLEEPDAHRISGTPLYIAPEIFMGQPATPRSDIYSLGVLLYHMVTAAYPVTAGSLNELKTQHEKRHVRLLRDERSDLPEAFIHLVERALAWDPAERFATAGSMEQALSAALGLEGVRPDTVRRASPLVKIATGLLAIAVLAAIGWFGLAGLRDRPDPGPRPPGAATGLPASADSYTVQAALYRERDGKRERLDSGDQLTIGDELALEVQASRELYVYIFNEDAVGNAFALFPLEGFDLQNPLAEGTAHLLPGPRNGEMVRWRVDSAGEREHLIVLASPEPLTEFEHELRRLARPQHGAMAVSLPDAAKERLRGIGGLAAAADGPPASGAGPLFTMARRLAGQAEQVEGVWMREIELANPK